MSPPSSEPTETVSKRTPGLPTWGGKYFALAVLFTMNLLNYVDRYSFFAAGKQIKKDLVISDDAFGVLGVSFMIVYTIISPPMGWMGDRYNRKLLLTGGVGLWSFATVGAAFSHNFGHMFFWRALLGVGEASYGVIAPALISDLFSVKDRGRAMGIYYLGLPLGSALGYLVGGWIAETLGWQAVFFVVGLPGLVVALAGLVMSDPGRGASEGGTHPVKAERPRMSEYLELLKTPSFVYNTLGMAAVTFGTGAYAAWGSIFYQRVYGLTTSVAGFWIGLVLVGAGLIGIGLGMVLPDLLPEIHQASVSASVCIRRAGCSSSRWGRYSLPSVRDITGADVRRLDLDGDGARAVEHSHRKRGAGSSQSHGLLCVHIFDPLSGRHQLADPRRLDLDPVRHARGGWFAAWPVVRVDRRGSCIRPGSEGHDQPADWYACGDSRARDWLRSLPDRRATSAGRSGKSAEDERRRTGRFRLFPSLRRREIDPGSWTFRVRATGYGTRSVPATD